MVDEFEYCFQNQIVSSAGYDLGILHLQELDYLVKSDTLLWPKNDIFISMNR